MRSRDEEIEIFKYGDKWLVGGKVSLERFKREGRIFSYICVLKFTRNKYLVTQ